MRTFFYGALFGMVVTVLLYLFRGLIAKKAADEAKKIEDKLNPHG